jgi:hypothetical protein
MSTPKHRHGSAGIEGLFFWGMNDDARRERIRQLRLIGFDAQLITKLTGHSLDHVLDGMQRRTP